MSKKNKELLLRPCVGIVVFNDQNKVWAGHRISPIGGELSLSNRRWQMPQGGIDKNEAQLDAAKRELWEETGITSVSLLAQTQGWINYELPEELIGKALKGKYRGQKMAWFAFRFEGEESEINIDNPPEGAPVEFDDWKWLDLLQMPSLVVPFKKQVYEEVVDSFRHLVE